MSIITLHDDSIIIFTDGAARGNPGRGGYGAVAIYPNAYGEPQVDEIGGREDMTTNNRMELRAVIEGLKNFTDSNYYQNLNDYAFTFYIDSAYVVNGATKWLHGWKKKNWITAGKEEVKNRDLWEELDELLHGAIDSMDAMESKGSHVSASGASGATKKHGRLRVTWKLIEGHAGVWGNERCDVIATSFADKKPDAPVNIVGSALGKLYTGSLADYASVVVGGENILNTKAIYQDKKDAMKARKKGYGSDGTVGGAGTSSSSSKKGIPAYSYVSAVEGKVHTDKTWAECEKRVKGKSGARFKKVFSADEEQGLMEEFGKGK